MFFHHLKNFSPYSGHIYDDMHVPFVQKKDGYLSKKDSRFDLMDRLGYFPFKELIRDDRAYFISDIDLYEFLNSDENTIDNYTAGYGEWNIAQKESFAECFFTGYNVGVIEFERNTGMAYHGYTIEQQTRYLHVFCLYCLDFLFFDGDLDKGLFYNLGYLQASFYRGFIEINNLKSALPDGSPGVRLHFESYNKVLAIAQAAKVRQEKTQKAAENNKPITPDTSNVKPPVSKQATAPMPTRIELLCNLDEIKSIWRVLTAPLNTKNGTEEAVFDAQQLAQFLGASFSSGAFPDALPFGKQTEIIKTSKGDMRNVLIALIFATYNINHEYNRGVTQMEYVGILKRHFSVFSGSGPVSIKNTLATFNPKGIKVIKNSQSVNPHVDEMLSILKKHKLLH
ncbi:hypothetical protein SAMN05216464_11143 [Mucilaginibacter pineti]|uniref:Uncharacterized protein n=1 Tax=Mucilaginibacter pineti TaxID=1391627 RepID=A0A1G7H3P2_9SPHI|nr:hypothetical protein [Mucilaginibacter pineti]SDE94985.1 hypothetical protein SAMN05216464_11143 [Mucilaginibacter pineti]